MHLLPIKPPTAGSSHRQIADQDQLQPERTQAGLAAARRIGRTGGRPPKLTDEDIEAAKALLANPDIGVTQIAHRLGVSPATFYRYSPPREPRICLAFEKRRLATNLPRRDPAGAGKGR